MPQLVSPSRRMTSRLEAPEDVWVYWYCNGREDFSRVLNISLGGLFIATSKLKPANCDASLHFLVQEGQIRADAVVRHAVPGVGIGLKFRAVKEEDRSHLAALLTRIRACSRSQEKT